MSTPTRTSADELRAAVTALRCDHQHPVQPPQGSLTRPGPCTACGTPWDGREPVPGWLREPLAAWLETETHMQVARGNSHEGPTFHALNVARAVRPGGDTT